MWTSTHTHLHCIHMHTTHCTNVYMHTMYIYIYIYIYSVHTYIHKKSILNNNKHILIHCTHIRTYTHTVICTHTVHTRSTPRESARLAIKCDSSLHKLSRPTFARSESVFNLSHTVYWKVTWTRCMDSIQTITLIVSMQVKPIHHKRISGPTQCPYLPCMYVYTHLYLYT